ncbi:HlyD family efflux transporter periplasmic adaptor subunit [Sandarakinorhabdus sp.]|uniref:HlyD family secretion protein n=1 Tax=Sandarakinorhabdus sp. TaxID=1916663 RepID=UPI00286E460D|nr:HlyD family efflux transporter periplasmic adaptor subunit [Sandarakinorhabdus sp.]
MPCSAIKGAGAAALVLLAGLGWHAAGRSDTAPRPIRPAFGATAQGRIDAVSETRWLAAEVDTRIGGVTVREGDTVVAGQVLMTLACDDLAADAGAARGMAQAAQAESRLVIDGPRREARDAAAARLAEAQARLTNARDQRDRSRALLAAGFVTSRRLTELESVLAGAEAARAAADAEWQSVTSGARADERRAAGARAAAAAAQAQAASARNAKCVIRAPIAGTILKVLKHAGEFSGAGAGNPLIAIADLSEMMVRAEFLDRDAAGVRAGQNAMIWLDEGKGRWHGVVMDSAGMVGRRTARSHDPGDRFDRDVREVRIRITAGDPPRLVGLRVNVGIAAS